MILFSLELDETVPKSTSSSASLLSAARLENALQISTLEMNAQLTNEPALHIIAPFDLIATFFANIPPLFRTRGSAECLHALPRPQKA